VVPGSRWEHPERWHAGVGDPERTCDRQLRPETIAKDAPEARTPASTGMSQRAGVARSVVVDTADGWLPEASENAQGLGKSNLAKFNGYLEGTSHPSTIHMVKPMLRNSWIFPPSRAVQYCFSSSVQRGLSG
jgi:hypothetical protein